MYICPVCKNSLNKEGRSYRCINNHNFDLAKQGYLNLLLSNQKNSKNPGDSKEMVLARKEFLEKDYYKPLANRLSDEILKLGTDSDNLKLLDAGCGEGYYTDIIYKKVNKTIYAVDISKEAVKHGARKNKNVNFFVASVFDLPFEKEAFDIVYSVFAPFKEEEFKRILKDNGYLIIVSPGKDHLYSLKKKLYENPYLNDEDKFLSDYFKEKERIKLSYKIKIENKEDIESLIKMTPYYWNTDKRVIEDYIRDADFLETEIDFLIKILIKN